MFFLLLREIQNNALPSQIIDIYFFKYGHLFLQFKKRHNVDDS